MTTEKRIFSLCDRVRETAFALHCYLRGCRVEHGLLVNFGAPKLEIRKYALTQPN